MTENWGKAVSLNWEKDLLFRAEAADNRGLMLDGDSREALSPMEGLLASLCGCMAIDVAVILKKMRLEPSGLKIEARGVRADDPPRYYKRIRLDFELRGPIPKEKAERAVELSFEKYCSVFHCLRPDIQYERSLSIIKTPVAGQGS